MTKAVQKITLYPSRDIPFDKLMLSQSNVRRIKAGVSVKPLAKDVDRHDPLQNLSVRPVSHDDGTEIGKLEIPARGRQFQALSLLVKQKHLAETTPILCIVRDAGSAILAEDDSLAENMQRVAQHPLDQFRAFATLRDKRQSDGEIAAAFFVTPLIVKQRMKLASVAPALLEVYAEDGMTLEQLMAFTVNPDHARQVQVWNVINSSWIKEPCQIRSLWVLMPMKRPMARCCMTSCRAMTDDEGAAHAKLLAEYRALEEEYAGQDEIPDEIDTRLGVLEAGMEKIETGQLIFAQSTIERTGAFVTLDRYGALAVYRGDVRPEDKPCEETAVKNCVDSTLAGQGDDHDLAGCPASAAHIGMIIMSGGQPIGGDLPEDENYGAMKPLPERLVIELTVRRTLVLREAIGHSPDVALTILLLKPVTDTFRTSGASGSCLDASMRQVYISAQASDLKDSAMAKLVDEWHAEWKADLPLGDDALLWNHLSVLDQSSLLALLAHCLSFVVNALHEKVNPYGGHLCRWSEQTHGGGGYRGAGRRSRHGRGGMGANSGHLSQPCAQPAFLKPCARRRGRGLHGSSIT